ncbi:hypothetical protein [Legionella quinlivanii]|uniref:hypothetical protein n=1 Tax=Legionella quinlivanii TaxID=45073 RepID=UPI0011C067DE|nr:hypothetical protein [Legionella quinlivanii]MCW8451440.1 hypothetical protein [Legionella quinlivanii]
MIFPATNTNLKREIFLSEIIMSSPQKPARKNYKKISDDQLDDLAGGRYAVDPVTGYEIPGGRPNVTAAAEKKSTAVNKKKKKS